MATPQPHVYFCRSVNIGSFQPMSLAKKPPLLLSTIHEYPGNACIPGEPDNQSPIPACSYSPGTGVVPIENDSPHVPTVSIFHSTDIFLWGHSSTLH